MPFQQDQRYIRKRKDTCKRDALLTKVAWLKIQTLRSSLSAECFDSSAFKSKLPQKKNFNLHVGPIGPIFLDLRSKRWSKLENLQLKVKIVKDFIMVGVDVSCKVGVFLGNTCLISHVKCPTPEDNIITVNSNQWRLSQDGLRNKRRKIQSLFGLWR